MNEEIENANENIGTMLYIMLGRVYDMLVLLNEANGNGEKVLRILELHKNGMLMCPLPSLTMLDDITTDDENSQDIESEQNTDITNEPF